MRSTPAGPGLDASRLRRQGLAARHLRHRLRGRSGAEALIQTAVPPGTQSVYTRVRLNLPARGVRQVCARRRLRRRLRGLDQRRRGLPLARDAARSARPGTRVAGTHESSNGATPDYGPLIDVSAAGARRCCVTATNVLAVGVWNATPASSDLVLVPQLVARTRPSVVTRGPVPAAARHADQHRGALAHRAGRPTAACVYGTSPRRPEPRPLSDPALPHRARGDARPASRPARATTTRSGTRPRSWPAATREHIFVTPPPPGTRAAARASGCSGDSGTARRERAARCATPTTAFTRHAGTPTCG